MKKRCLSPKREPTVAKSYNLRYYMLIMVKTVKTEPSNIHFFNNFGLKTIYPPPPPLCSSYTNKEKSLFPHNFQTIWRRQITILEKTPSVIRKGFFIHIKEKRSFKMKKIFKLIGIIALVAIIGFSFAACEEKDDPPPSPPDLSGSITISPSTEIIGIELTATYSGSEAVNYQWKNGTTNTGTNSKNFTPTEAGSYTVTVSATGYNSKTSTAVTIPISKWTAVTYRLGNEIRAIAYGNGKFVAVGADGKMATSTDGTTWTAVTDSTFGTDVIFSIAYGNGKFIAGGGYNTGKMATSENGTTWTAVTDSTFGTNRIFAIAYGNDKFVAGDDSGKMATSENGATWTVVTDSTFGTSWINTIAYANGKFVAVGNGGKMATSTDGTTWTAVDTGTIFDYVNNGTTIKGSINAIAYGNGKFVAVGSSGKMANSTDGTKWTAVTGNTFGTSNIFSITYGNGKFVTVGNSGKTAYSMNGTTWTAVTWPFTTSSNVNNIYAIAFGNNMFVAGGINGMAYSTGF